MNFIMAFFFFLSSENIVRPYVNDTSRPGGQESDYDDALWEL